MISREKIFGTADVIDYVEIIKKYPWLIIKNQKCIISPDADGMLCGLLMSHYLNWEIVGYYDNGKNLILKNGVKAKDCIFLDTEINRSNIKSVGHHITFFRHKDNPANLENYKNCFNPNHLRGRTHEDNFSLKYPMATVHLLLCILNTKIPIKYRENSFFVILQADGTINRFLDKYSSNLYDWLCYLGAEDPKNILHRILKKEVNLLDLNKDYVQYIQKFVKGKKDKILISEKGLLNTDAFNKNYSSFSELCIKSTSEYLEFLSKESGWVFDRKKWVLNNFQCYEFIKKIVKPGVRTFATAVNENFLSLAITAGDKMEYTLDEHRLFSK